MKGKTAYAQALREIKARVASSRTSFGAGMAILPRPRREAMLALYAFCREVDDIADDDGKTAQARLEELGRWRRRIGALFSRGEADESITVSLSPAVEGFGLAEADFQDIILGMEMDIERPIIAPDMATLDLYCDRVASAVGRASVRIFGDSGEKAMAVAHHLGRALQLTNILRDLSEDAARGRLYLPSELLSKHKVTSRIPAEALREDAIRPVCRELAALSRRRFRDAFELMRECAPSAMRPARVMGRYYSAILDRLEKGDWKEIGERVRLPKWQKLWLLFSSVVG